MSKVTRCLGLLALLTVVVAAQSPGANWSMTTTATNPPLRRENPGVSDGVSMYVFGGQTGNSGGVPLNDLWRFDGVNWVEMTANGAAGSPPARDRAGITWDALRGVLVVYGGEDAAGAALGDTWEWDPVTNTWADVTPAGGNPTARKFVALAWDAVNQRVLMFGGLDATNAHLNDTWHFDGASWTQLAPTGPQPGVRRQHVMVERPDFFDVIMCGGQEAGGFGMYGDTWRWDGATWTQVPTTNSPAGRVAIDAAYDQIRQRIVIAGGNPGPTGAISEFDAITNDWVIRPLDPGIYKVTRYFMAYVPALGKTYKVSGQALNAAAPAVNTYEFQSDVVGSFNTTGTGCAGAGGVPTLVTNGRPWLDRTYMINVMNVAPTEDVILFLSLTDTNWGPFMLPLDLSPFGLTGCTLYVQPEIEVPLGLGAAAGPWALPLPNAPVLAGTTFFTQAVAVNTMSGGVALSAKGTSVIGIL